MSVTTLEGSCSKISVRHWLTAFSGVQTKLITYVHFRKIFLSVFFAYAMMYVLGGNFILLPSKSLLFSTKMQLSYCFAFSVKWIVFYWSIEIQHVWKHCSVTSPILFIIRLSTDKQFTTRLGRNERESDWRWCQVTQLCVSLSLHLDRSSVTKYGSSLRVQLRVSQHGPSSALTSSCNPLKLSPRLLYSAYSAAYWQSTFFDSDQNDDTWKEELPPPSAYILIHFSPIHTPLYVTQWMPSKEIKTNFTLNRPRWSRRGVQIYPYSFFNLGYRWGIVSTPWSGRFTPAKRAGTHCTGDWVGPRAGLEGRGKSLHHRDSIPGSFRPYRVAIPTELTRPTTLSLEQQIKTISSLAPLWSWSHCRTHTALWRRGHF
jgi:hypothetical protein